MNYREIYEQHNGLIPVDREGRTYEIHHKDGNRKNNDPSNLVALSIQEHYDIHYKQGDYGACIRIMSRMSMSPEEISKNASKINFDRAKKGKHPFQRRDVIEKTQKVLNRMLENGTHPFKNSEMQRKKAQESSRRRVSEGTHHFCDSDFHKKHALNRVENGTHNFQKQQKVECPHCKKVGNKGPMHLWHFDKCKWGIK